MYKKQTFIKDFGSHPYLHFKITINHLYSLQPNNCNTYRFILIKFTEQYLGGSF